MGKAMIRMHVLRLFAEHYARWKKDFPFDEEDTRQIYVPVKHLRMAHEIVTENDENRGVK